MTNKPLRLLVAVGLGAMLLAACGNSVEKAFSNCVAIAEKQALSGNKGILTPELSKIYEKASRGLAEKQCSIIRDECRNNAQSADCQHLIQQYGKN